MESLSENRNFLCVCEFLPNHLYFVTVRNINNGGSCDAVISHTDDLHFFTTDNELVYHNFYSDFGPLSITCLYKFCKKLMNKLATYAGDSFYERFVGSRFGGREIADKLRQKFLKNKIIVYYTSTNNEKRANAAYLISAFSLLYLGFSPREAYKTLQANKMRYRPFQDASVGLSPYKITMKDCLNALYKASAFGFFNFNDFNITECSYYENTEHGNLSWIIPRKFLAFPSPVEDMDDHYHHPNFYIEYFLCNSVTDIIRLNQRTYDAKCFTIFKIRHHDLFMQDGADPPDSVLESFMKIAESAAGAVAVHCKAGLGRTGTLIGAYLLKHYRMTPREAIAWIRICRPGSVIGHQQAWLEDHKSRLWCHGNEWRYKKYGKTEIVPFSENGIYSLKAPKKEFRGLRELLITLTKRSKYSFFVKNPFRKSNTKFQQAIRAILSSARISEEMKAEELEKESYADSSVLQIKDPNQAPKQISSQLQSQHTREESSNNIHYLKLPSPMSSFNEAPYTDGNLEYFSSYSLKHPPASQGNAYTYEYPSQPQQSSEYYDPNLYSYPATYETKQLEKQSNPNRDDGEFFNLPKAGSVTQNSNHEKQYRQQKPQVAKASLMPKCQSEYLPPRHDRGKLHAGIAQSINANWKRGTQDEATHPNVGSERKRQGDEGEAQKAEDVVCAFDTRKPHITEYSRFNRPYVVEETERDMGDFY